MLYSGKLIECIRKEQRVNLKTLAHGLCSVSHLKLIEGGERSAEKLLFESLYQRLGKYSGRFEMLLDLDEYVTLEKRWQICNSIDGKRYDEAYRLIDEYRNSTNNKIHLQYLCLAECEVMHRTGVDTDKCMDKLMEGLRYTYPEFDIDKTATYYLSRLEMYMAQQYIRYMELSGERDRAVKLYHNILRSLESDRYDRSERELLYRHMGYWLMKHYMSCENYYKALEIGEKTYRHTVSGAFIMFLAELKEGIIICREMLGQDMTEERKILDILKRMNRKFGVKSADEFFLRYTEERAYNVNDVIRQRRILHGMTQEELAGDICDISTLSKVENNKQTLSERYREKMLQKLNMSGDKYVAHVDTYDYKVFAELNRIRDAIDEGKFDEAERILEDVLNNYELDTVNSRQYIFAIKENISMWKDNGMFATSMRFEQNKDDAILWYEEKKLKNVILFENEWRMRLDTVIKEKRKEAYDKAYHNLEDIICSKNKKLYMCSSKDIILKREKADILGEMGQIEQAKKELEEAIIVSVKTDILSYLPSITYIYAWNILEKKIDGKEKDINTCKEMLEYSFVLSNVYNNKDRVIRINSLCVKHKLSISI